MSRKKERKRRGWREELPPLGVPEFRELPEPSWPPFEEKPFKELPEVPWPAFDEKPWDWPEPEEVDWDKILSEYR